MKALITILIIVGVAFGAYKIWEYWDNVQQERDQKQNAPVTQISPGSLPGLPQKMEQGLTDAEKGGPKALKAWLDKAKPSGAVKDPRLAWIELDYVLMITKDDPVEAKRIFRDVQQRIPADSPVAKRVKALEKNYE
jgi:hypothetical protein